VDPLGDRFISASPKGVVIHRELSWVIQAGGRVRGLIVVRTRVGGFGRRGVHDDDVDTVNKASFFTVLCLCWVSSLGG
jgi:hypothetical protein